jgi:mxaJ protein
MIARTALALTLAALPGDGAPRVLRVCADPAGLPFSNDRGEGFENAVAGLLARDLGARLETTWWANRRGFLRSTLKEGRCDVVIGVPKGLDAVRTTKPWYRSTFAFVTRAEDALGDLRSIDDPRLRSLRIGVPLSGDDGANPPPIHVLARRGVVDNVQGFPLYAELGEPIPRAIAALERHEIDVAMLWGPVAAGGARRSHIPLVVRAIAERRDAEQPLTFAIAMATRKSEDALARELDGFIDRRQPELRSILDAEGIPRVEDHGAP